MSAIAILTASARSPAAPIRVACVGASVTFGDGLKERGKECYPAQMQKMLGEGYEVRNFGVNGRAMLKKADFPYWVEGAYRRAQDFDPNIVILDLGGNDTKPQNWAHKGEFVADTKEMVAAFRALPAKPRVILFLPSPVFADKWGISDERIMKEARPLVQQAAFEAGVEMFDNHTPWLDHADWFPDQAHPNAEASALMGRLVGEVVGIKADAEFDFEKSLAARKIDAKVTSFYGYRQLNFALDDGSECTVVRPYSTAAGRPLAWRGEFFGVEPQTDLALLERGFHVVYVKTPDMYGSPASMKVWEKTHAALVKAGLTGKISLIGLSRGGLACYNWAAAHPETVGVLYGDAPVCDIKSWPGKNRSTTTKTEWAQLMKAYAFKDDAEALAYAKNPIDNLAPLAKAGIPIIHVVGQADTEVPVAENTDIVEKRYKELGGTMVVIRKPNVGHHPHSLPNPQQIVDFITSHNK